MSLFLLSFFLLYGGVHLYLFLKVKAAFAPGPAVLAALALFLLAMLMAPILVRIAERHGLEGSARLLAYAGYVWMGVLFLIFSAALVLDIYHHLLHVAGLVMQRSFAPFLLSSRTAFLVALCWGVLAALYAYYEALNIRLERVVITTPKIPANVGRITLVQLSDVHLGLIVREARLTMMLDRVREASPDILVVTGDLLDGQINGLPGLAELLAEVRPRYGKYAVTGNHEFYAGLDPSLAFMERAGLRGEAVTVAGMLQIAGIDDPAAGWATHAPKSAEQRLLAPLSRNLFTLFLKHRPAVAQESPGLFDLQLSGHVHKGQLFPFNLVTHLFYPVKMGYSRLSHGSSIYVSRGTGTWGPPLRFLAPPEVTVIELVHPGSESH